MARRADNGAGEPGPLTGAPVRSASVQFAETRLAGAWLIDLEPHTDERGAFSRTFCEREFADHGLPTRFPQCNLSSNTTAGTLRGIHFNAEPYGEAKLVRCVRGALYDVIVDLRDGSPTRLAWFGTELTADNGRALFVPTGFAHGFVTLDDATDAFYHMGEFYRPGAERGVRWDDPALGIDWPVRPTVISERDAGYPDIDPATFDAATWAW
jgi:dTDP-4-dehydrorhamnose 3,5-epimerase